MRSILPALAAVLTFLAATNVGATEVMILGTYHMANPGRDIHNLKADDVMADQRQRELVDLASALARFEPTKIAVEQPTEKGAPARLANYHEYLEGKLAPSRNEVVQIGFRVARAAHLSDVFGIDSDGDFPYEAVKKFADDGHPRLAKQLDELGAAVDRMLKRLDEILKAGTVSQGLRFLNEPRQIIADNAFYARMLEYGEGNNQPGATLLSAWQARNNSICARLVQLATPQDRIIVVYGSGHAFLLRRCVQDMPGFKLVEANAYLPK